MKATSIRLFIKPYCPWCQEAEAWLKDRNIPYTPMDVTADRAARDEMQLLTGQTKAPCIDVDGEILADFDTDQLAQFWKQFE